MSRPKRTTSESPLEHVQEVVEHVEHQVEHGVTFSVEPWKQFRQEAAWMWAHHWDEVALDKDAIHLDVDVDQYEAQEMAGALAVIVGRRRGKIVAYWLGFVRPHFHYRRSLTAYTDIYFVSKDYRKGHVGRDLFAFVEQAMRARGVQRLFTATKCHLDHSAFFEAQGYQRVEVTYSKRLDGTPDVEVSP